MRYSDRCDRCVIFYLFIFHFIFLYFYHSDVLNTYVKCALIMHISLSLFIY